jgi:Na+/melibiose symporter-like transporter
MLRACVSGALSIKQSHLLTNQSVLTGSTSRIRQPETIAILAIGAALIPTFIVWVGRQEKLGRPAVIPNSLWRNRVFTAICANVFITWGTFNATEQLLTFVFQDVQKLSPLEASIRFLPAPVAGTISNIVMGLIAHKVNADRPVLVGNVLSTISPLILALMNPKASYWANAFPAMALNAIGADTLFTVSNLVITSVFPEKTQALAGGVFNTVAQIGKTVGLATAAVIAASATSSSGYKDKEGPEALMEGYSAAYWYCFALCLLTIVV